MKFIYSLGIRFYGFAILVASLFNEKAKKWRAGRSNIFSNLQKSLQGNKAPLIWYHCASLGEFEQGRPVIEAFRQKFPQYKILLTFFSPSGYEVRKDYSSADYVFYLPLDTYANAKRFIEIINPQIAVFVKYEFWYNYLHMLGNKGVLIYLISARFRAEQYFFKWYGAWFRKQLNSYNRIFLQDADSEKILKATGVENITVAGDTRFDRVISIAGQAKADNIIESLKNGNKLWICGSTWEEDENLIHAVYNRLIASGEKIKLLIVPHEIGEKHIKQVTEQFSADRYSEVNAGKAGNSNVLVVDKMGMLSSLYHYADVAYIGGGFGKGIHNLPEAAVFGIPVLFGPNYHKFNEAIDLIRLQAGFSVSSETELGNKMELLLKDNDLRKKCGDAAKAYIYGGSGATGKIVAELEKAIKA
ncbi:MAG: 3-deoxy-D-manno-octulosonic acid transferase [Bacteroidia bacterium]